MSTPDGYDRMNAAPARNIPPRPRRSPVSAFPAVPKRRPTRRRKAPERRNRPLAAVIALALLALMVWGLSACLGGSGGGPTASPGPYAQGDCLADADPTAGDNRTVPCIEPHSAQLVAVGTADEGAYPGREALEADALRLCGAANLNLPADTSSLKQRAVVPTQDGWQNGDRRTECFIVSTGGKILTGSLLP
ncbi:septum formation family protein [Sinomonas mesophila]|uniref:septum formation family protein n=1 Tax=Sinomonas mesophila TaxID=1531955 RepID=UPI0011157C4C|nr:septum formation family protein [Sinomonas mesophila]